MTLAAAILLSGCAVGPSTHPRTATPGPARAANPPATTQSFFDSLAAAGRLANAAPPLDTTGAIAWLGALRDTQLVALVRTALRNNRDMQSAVARVREYRALYGAARGELFPQLSGNASEARSRTAFGSISIPPFNQYRATLDLQWELDFWGRVRRTTEAARFDLGGREEDRQAVLLTLVGDVATAYLELKELDEDLRIAEQTLGTRQQTLQLARQRFQQGVISELDARQFESEVATTAARVAQYSRLRAWKENQLNVLLGGEPGPVRRGGSLGDAVAAVAVPDSLPSTLVVRRPDVQRAQADWSAALARTGAAQAARLPRFAVTANWGRQSTVLDSLFKGRSEVYSVGVGLSVPLFTGGRVENQARAASARADQARLRYEQTVLTALRETSDALTGVRLGRDELAAQETQVRALRRALDLAQRRYESGVSSYFEVLDVQRNLFNAEVVLVSVQRQYLVATVQLYKALGGSWEGER